MLKLHLGKNKLNFIGAKAPYLGGYMKLPSTIGLIDEYYEKNIEKPRPHLGCSIIGHKCDRYLWYSFRWAFIEKHEGRMKRLFNVGHQFEPIIIKDLRDVGVDIRSPQTRVNFGCHVAGSLDGVIYSGLTESPNKKHIAEFKTHSEKSFNELVKSGVEKAKPLHYVQMQAYMLGTEIDRAFYIAINKNTSELYSERIRLDRVVAEKHVARAKRITMMDRMPEPMSADPTWYECQYCHAKGMCHKGNPTKEANCRTCAHSTPRSDSTWYCERWESEIPTDAQYNGCDSHVLHPDLVPYKMKSGHGEWSAIYIIDGNQVINGEDGFKSTEIIANPRECSNPSEFTQTLRTEMGAKIV